MTSMMNGDSNGTVKGTWPDKFALPVMAWLAVGLAVFHLWYALDTTLPATQLRPIHLVWVLVLILLRFPSVPAGHSLYTPLRLMDVLLALGILWAGWVTATFDHSSIDHLRYGLNASQQFAGALLLVMVLECTRRAVGWEMALIGTVFLVYSLAGHLLPEVIANRGFSFERVLRFQVFTTEGIFGAPLGIAASTVFLFVLFGAFLEVTGAGRFFIDLAYAAAGKYRGGPAKAAVLASAGMGSISGSAIANAATSGAFTIPMMKRLGYQPKQAAGIEAAASTGGQIMPPIMGAGAFIMAEYTNTPYSTIVAVAIAPAALYFIGVLLSVHLMAAKLGLKGMDKTPPLRDTLVFGFHFIVPLVLITALLLMNYSPARVGVVGCIAVLVAALLRAHTRPTLRVLFTGLKNGALMMLPISAACATAGIVVGALGQTGIGLEFTGFVVSLAGGHLWLALLLVALAALVLGLGLPVTAAYILLAVMAAPALGDLGVPVLVAHMVIFWLSQSSNVTPPVALAAFASAGIAGARPLSAAFEAFKLAKGLFILPLLMVYGDLIWVEGTSAGAYALSLAMALLVMMAFTFVLENRLFTRLHSMEAVALLGAIAMMLHPGLWSDCAGAALTLAVMAFNYRASLSSRL
ncbi:TRAP transporter fused permease subunit [Marinimicrobium sp. ABcell2]|uniref:TRAP transporter permease n=1 Tax=Marinimicrobium sp. ABcell2 TaxID=3069751 RepID=UPI0027AF768D|nr:TRAP transporter fused permease subunit [Marinimicrobium sp. ABcell2]MDQ2077869.1 TRAP transporter fused permease subunit [Marinimicrobium sp. ABcell2]